MCFFRQVDFAFRGTRARVRAKRGCSSLCQSLKGMSSAMRAVNSALCFIAAFIVTLGGTVGAGALSFISPALADGMPHPRETSLQESATPIMTDIVWFYYFLLAIMAGVVVLVLGLLIYVMIRFNSKANPEPSKTSHNTLIEVIWTIFPVLILIVIALPSFSLLFKELNIPDADMTVKTTGYQWYWGYEYPDHNGISFTASMIAEEDLQPDQLRNLSVDNPMVVPVDTTVRMIVTGGDVIHSWTIPAFGVKIDAIPGRLNETWFRAERTGTFFGQCSELCGMNHAFMPIEVRVVEQAEFDAWIASQQAAQGLLPEEKVAEVHEGAAATLTQ